MEQEAAEGLASASDTQAPLATPVGCHDPKIQNLRDRLWAATSADSPTAVQQAVPVAELRQTLARAANAFKSEPALLELSVEEPCQVFVVGDTHGQFHDVCHMLDTFGYPDRNRLYVFNGDYVDRGSWGFEVLMLLLQLKLEYPDRCYMLRGNHESTTCTTWYGFKSELAAKWGKEATSIYAAFKKLFSLLPLAALVNKKTIVLHGGLFRDVAPPVKPAVGKAVVGGRRKRRKTGPAAAAPPAGPLRLGTLDTLRAASKGGADPDGLGTTVVAADVLWSDPGIAPGLQENDARGVGLVFGPDITQTFLEENGLQLVIRSHEGPDARDKRGDLPQVLEGWSVDHTTPAGQLMTLFSAPDYPQFMAPEEGRYNNKGAVAVLAGPSWCTPDVRSFEAVKPRPKAVAFYDYLIYADTDEEPAGSCQEDGEELAADGIAASDAGGAESAATASQPPGVDDDEEEGVEEDVSGLAAAGQAVFVAGGACQTDAGLTSGGGLEEQEQREAADTACGAGMSAGLGDHAGVAGCAAGVCEGGAACGGVEEGVVGAAQLHAPPITSA